MYRVTPNQLWVVSSHVFSIVVVVVVVVQFSFVWSVVCALELAAVRDLFIIWYLRFFTASSAYCLMSDWISLGCKFNKCRLRHRATVMRALPSSHQRKPRSSSTRLLLCVNVITRECASSAYCDLPFSAVAIIHCYWLAHCLYLFIYLYFSHFWLISENAIS